MQSISGNNIKGIDVSHHQGTIDWQKVKAAGVDFSFVKATEGVGYIDPMFRRNAVGAPAAGLKIGFYHYARPETGNTAAQEAESFVESVNGLPSDLPHVLDLEGASANLGRDKLTEWAYQWLDKVRKRTGHKVMLYTGGSFARTYCGSKLAEFPLWIAHYGVDTPMNNPTWSRWSVFQYASNGHINGIASANVDLNVMEEDFWNGITGQKSSPFSDVPAEHWAAGIINQAFNLGLVSGYPDGTFQPDKMPTRAEMVAIAMRIVNLKGGK